MPSHPCSKKAQYQQKGRDYHPLPGCAEPETLSMERGERTACARYRGDGTRASKATIKGHETEH